MRRRLCPLVLLAAACAPVARVPLALPPREAPLEVRAAAYRANMGAVHNSLWRSWQVQFGDDPTERPFRDARPVLENAPEAARVLRERDQQMRLGWGLFGGGVGLTLGGLAMLPLAIDARERDTDRAEVLAPALVSLAGVILMSVSTFILGAAEPRVTYAVDAYNRWLWDALALPRARALSPALSATPSGLVPWPAPVPAAPPPWTAPPSP